MTVLNRKDALSGDFVKYFTGKPCKHGHISPRFTMSGVCVVCNKLHVSNNKEYHSLYQTRYRSYKPEKGRIKATKWQKNNLPLCAANNARRRAAKLNATPVWVDVKALKEIYLHCPKSYHVDHIVPLMGTNVSGLHVPWNLQYLPAAENISKGNRLIC